MAKNAKNDATKPPVMGPQQPPVVVAPKAEDSAKVPVLRKFLKFKGVKQK